jgi:hypothetical protein
MRENRRFQRVKPSGRMAATGKIIADPKAPPIDVGIVDLSAGGACLALTRDIAVPKRFTLVHGTTRKSCNLVWKKGYRLGVAF